MTPIPFMTHCRIVELEAPDATARLAVDAVDPLTNRRGEAHGGLLMTMLDIALGKACQKVSEGATSFVTIDLNVAFLAPGSGRIVAEGRVLRAGRSIVFCEGEARDAGGVLLAKASGVFKPFVPR
jgi:uncharacterized protein (TIGR00369 family)